MIGHSKGIKVPRKLFLFLVVLGILVSSYAVVMSEEEPSSAATFTVDGITYSTITTTTVQVGDGTNPTGSSSASSITIPSTVTSGSVTYNVTVIGNNAFYNRSNIQTISIPNSIASIGSNAFYGCTGITALAIPASVTSIGTNAFYNCTSITSLTIPVNITVTNGMFYGCNKITSVTIIKGSTATGPNYTTSNYMYTPWYISRANTISLTIADDVTFIGNYTFYNCTGIKSLTMPVTIGVTSSTAFSGCTAITSVTLIKGSTTGAGYVYNSSNYAYTPWYFSRNNTIVLTIENGVTSIGDYTFYKCIGIKSLVLPEGVTSIGSTTFRDCTGITSLTLPQSLTSIGSAAFRGCTGITSLTIPTSVTSIGGNAFNGCTGITSLTMPINITIASGMFNGCNKITSLTLTKGSSGAGATYTATTATYTPWYISRTNTMSVTIADGVTSIGSYTFYNCTGIASLTISNTVTSINTYAFYGCNKITSLTIPNSVTAIGANAFYNCTAITSLTMPINITITSGMFNGCNKITSLTLTKGSTGTGATYTVTTATYTPWYISRTNTMSVTIADDVISIGNYAFYNCTGVRSLTMPITIAATNTTAFTGCTGITSVTLTKGSTGTGATYTSSNYMYTPWYISRNGIISLTIADDVTSIGNYAFYNCTGAISFNISLSSSLTSIGDYAFYNCDNLVSIEVPSSVTYIGDYSFSNCGKLNSLTFSDNISYLSIIGSNSFSTGLLTSVSIPLVKTGYSFNGWYTSSSGGTLVTSSMTVTTTNNSVDLYARWTVNTYTVEYNGNGSTGGSMSSQSFTYGIYANLTSNAYTRSGYTFTGWNTALDGSGTSYSDSQMVGDLTTVQGATVILYAQWNATTLTVTYPTNTIAYYVSGGSTSLVYGSSCSFSITVYDPYNKTSPIVWANGVSISASSISGSTYTYTIDSVTTNIVFTETATWSKNVYTVTLPVSNSAYVVTGQTSAVYGENYYFTITVNPGYSSTVPIVTCYGNDGMWVINNYGTIVYEYHVAYVTNDLTFVESQTWSLNTYSVSGTLTVVGGASSVNVAVVLNVDGMEYTALTTTGGAYTIIGVPYGSSGSITASISGYMQTVTPTVSSMTSNQTGKDLTLTIAFFQISGTVHSSDGALPSGTYVLLTCNGVEYTATVNLSTGAYSISGLQYGVYVVKAVATGYSSTTLNLDMSNGPSSISGQDLTISLQMHTLTIYVVSSSGIYVPGCAVNVGSYDLSDTYSAVYGTYSGIISFGTSGLSVSKDGYTFSNWKYYGTSVTYSSGDSFVMGSEDTTIVVSMSLIEYYATFNASGSIVSILEFDAEDMSVVAPSVPYVIGYMGEWEQYTLTYADITIYAQYSPITYTIIYHSNYGSDVTYSQSCTYDVMVTLASTIFTRGGYTLICWSGNDDGSGTVYVLGTQVENLSAVDGSEVDLYAVWFVDLAFVSPSVTDDDLGSVAVEESDQETDVGTYDVDFAADSYDYTVYNSDSVTVSVVFTPDDGIQISIANFNGIIGELYLKIDLMNSESTMCCYMTVVILPDSYFIKCSI